MGALVHAGPHQWFAHFPSLSIHLIPYHTEMLKLRLRDLNFRKLWMPSSIMRVALSSVVSSFRCDKIAHLANSSVFASKGDTVVHAVVCVNKYFEPKDASLPLNVEYVSKSYALGLIPQQAKRREPNSTDEETLVSRFIDRSVRPLFPKGSVSEVQLTVTAHAIDGVNDPTVLAVNAASLALARSSVPWSGPIGCVRVGYIEGKLVVNPSVADMKNSSLDFLYAGTSTRPVMWVYNIVYYLLFCTVCQITLQPI
jgi:polyribonucleotide nucleotidyltransferase